MNARTVQFLAQNTRCVHTLSGQGVAPSTAGLPPLENFIANLLARSSSRFDTMISAVVYLRRLQRLEAHSGLPHNSHAIFAGALILAAKVINDSSLPNNIWSMCTYQRDTRCRAIPHTGFSCRELNRIERQLLSCLRWDVHFNEKELRDSFKMLVRCARYTHLELARCVRPAVLKVCLADNEREVWVVGDNHE